MSWIKISRPTGEVLYDSRLDDISKDDQSIVSAYDRLIQKSDDATKVKFQKIREAAITRAQRVQEERDIEHSREKS